MTYEETLDYIYARLPMFSRVGSAALKTGFDNILSLCRYLGNPESGKKFIHIAGTNGKGSVSHMLAAVLQTQGYKTGLYTSPHLIDLRERIKIDGAMISREEVVSFIDTINLEIERLKPSFFEIMVAMAFDHFNTHNIDIAIIETGLGGRLDSTNIIKPVLSVITNIGYDHMQLLGNTLELIAGEKAGIIKQKVPVVIGETHPQTEAVFIKKAAENEAALSFADQQFSLANWSYEKHHLLVEVAQQHKVDHIKYKLDLAGVYQSKNLLTVLESCRQLNKTGIVVDEVALQKGVAHAKRISGLHGRWEIIQENPTLVLDVAHNEDGILQVLNQLELMTYRQLHIVLGMVKDKDIDKVLGLLPQNAVYYFAQANIPRALPAYELLLKAGNYDLMGKHFQQVNEAITAAKNNAHTDDLILVCGSVFLVGEVSVLNN